MADQSQSVSPGASAVSRVKWRDAFADVRGGLVASTTCLGFSIANGALIYSAVPQPMLVRGIVAGLVTTAVGACILALTSTFRPVIATANAVATGPIAAIVVAAAPALASLPANEAVATGYTLVAVTTAVAGLFLLALGFGRLGKLVRYIPFPVVAGFMGELGALLVLGATRFCTGHKVAYAELAHFAEPRVLILLAAVVGYAALIDYTTRRFTHPLFLPALLLGTALAVNAVAYVAGGSIDSPTLAGVFLAPRSLAAAYLPLLTAPPTSAHWQVIGAQAGGIAAYALLVALAVLITSTRLESALDVDADYDRELKAQGAANIANALLGGFTGNPSFGSTMAGVGVGARGRLAGLTNAMVMLAFLAVGLPLLPYIPRFVVGGLLMQVGARIVWNNCVGTRTKMPRGEWLLIIAIVVITILVGLVPAILVGIVGGCVLFALDVSRIDVVRRRYGLDCRTSPLVRSGAELATLTRDGRRIQFVELSGTLFFGSAHGILERVREAVAAEAPASIVLDLSAVVACDSSAADALARMRKILGRDGIGFALAGGRPDIVALLRSAGCVRPSDPVYATRNEALEASEAVLLAQQEQADPGAEKIEDWLGRTLGDRALAAVLAPELEVARYAKGEYLCRMGEPTDTLLFIESGRVGVMVGPLDAEVCVRVFGPHSIAGEHGFVLQLPRSASLEAQAETLVHVLQRRVFERLSAERPELAIALLRDIVALQSERLAFATRQAALLN